MQHGSDDLDRIAVIGIAGRFPSAPNLDQFWKNLCNGVESVTAFTDEQLLAAGVEPADLKSKDCVKAGVLLEDVDLFDAGFFGYNPRDAELMDPQHRFFLECAWEALEDAGYDANRTRLRIGVFAGTGTNSYFRNNLAQSRSRMKSLHYLEKLMAADNDYLATRVSYKLNLKGPSLTVQTACSTSMVAIHMACQSLLNGECDVALAGAASIKVPQIGAYAYEEGSTLSPDARCRAFDAAGQGMMPGSGVGVVVLKRFPDALTDRDSIRAVVRGSAINNDGAGKVGYTAPSVDGQAAVISDAMGLASVDADEISYIEAHGTGTRLGDPIEVAALTEAFRKSSQKTQFCGLGSVKTNIGHLGAAAGVAGFLKVILALQHRKLPPSLNYQNPNPAIDFPHSPFFVQQKLTQWTPPSGKRIAGISSFGIGGTNAHAVLEEPPVPEPSGPTRSFQLLPLSANSATALDRMRKNLGSYLENHQSSSLADIAYTLQTGRKNLPYRQIFVCKNHQEAVAAMGETDPSRQTANHLESSHMDVVFMFPGQGSQYANMSSDLYGAEPEFRRQVDLCCEIIQPYLSLDLRQVLYPGASAPADASERLERTLLAQPALFVIEYALAKLLMSWGIRPTALVGHSVGEYVAACLAGVISLDDALKLVCARGGLMQSLPGGSMLAVSAAASEVEGFLPGDLSLAAVNSPRLCVVSGESEVVSRFAAELSKRDIASRLLHTSHAFHSRMMDPIVADFAARAAQVEYHPAQIPIVSTVTGTWANPEEMTAPEYWARNLRQTVRFSDAVQELLKDPDRVLLEVGPGNTLGTCARQHVKGPGKRVVLSTLRHPLEQNSDLAYLLNTVGKLWMHGVDVDWTGFYKDETRRRVPLPTYPFERQRYWIEPAQHSVGIEPARRQQGRNPDFNQWFYVPSWKRADLPGNGTARAPLPVEGPVLLFLDKQGLGADLAGLLRHNGQIVTTVEAGSGFKQSGDGSFAINPSEQNDYRALWDALSASSKLPCTIVHLWCVGNKQDETSPADAYERYRVLGFNSLLFLTQAIAAKPSDANVQIKVVSNHMHEVTGNEFLSPAKAIILGPCMIAPQEHLNIHCSNIDVEDGSSGESARLLMKELAAKSGETVIAYRGTHRWVQTLEHISLPKIQPESLPLRQGAVCLITGGLGGIGLALAGHLADRVRAKLVLVSRTGLPASEEWPGWLRSHGEEDDVCRKIRAIQSIEARGSQVLVLRADVADAIEMRDVFKQTREKFGAIHGVIHAAGVIDDPMAIVGKTSAAAESVMAPKVLGTTVLGELLREAKPDFLMLCSSRSVQTGGFGYVDYCAANAFLDAYARKHHTEMNIVSINWGLWQKVGMGLSTQVPAYLEERKEQRLSQGILPEEGTEAFDRILGSHLAQVIVSPQELTGTFAGAGTESTAAAATVKAAEPELEPAHERPAISSEFVAPGNPTEKAIAEIWRELLGLSTVGIHDNFFELGGHSLMAAGLLARLKSTFPIELSIASLFENPTVHSLSEMVRQQNREPVSFDESKSRGQKRREARSRA